jgi:hypothetical protein
LIFARQLRGELRKLWHPLVALSVLCAAAVVCAMQAANVRAPYPGPSMADVSGCLRIAFLQHATAVGFVLAGVLAAFGTAEELGSGAIADTLVREPRRGRVLVLKSTAVCCALLASTLLATAALWLTGSLERAQGVRFAKVAGSTWTAALTDVSASLLVIPLASAVAVVLALVTRSTIATVITTGAVFALPLAILQDAFVWLTPTRWIVEWLHLDPLGQGVDYLANNSAYDHRAGPAFISGALIVLSTVALLAFGGSLLWRATTVPAERV